MFRWTEESIDWWKRAVPYSNYYKCLAGELRKYIDERERVFDIGCGLGNVSLELCPFVRRITGYDIDDTVLKEFEKEVRRRSIDNIDISIEKWECCPDHSCDTVIACSFGIMEDDLHQFLRIARKQVIVVRGRKEDSGMEVLPQGREYKAGKEERYLIDNHIPYQKKSFYADFGQPLRSREEAERFLTFYGMTNKDEINAFLDRNLVRTGSGGEQYFLPNRKEVVMLVIPKEAGE